ncbi:hypothetical protein ACFYO2_40410 [Streptomyces sp. NPDC006602]|uniref:hypothetical protein n=1 Tax=Streptomyces sp. NPDC006602 TaxID=3364751 RepID=UPI0036CA2136
MAGISERIVDVAVTPVDVPRPAPAQLGRRARALSAAHHRGLRDRDDTGYMRRFDPSFSLKTPRW